MSRASKIQDPDATQQVGIVRLENALDLKLPEYESSLATGMDLRAACHDPISIGPGQRALVPTGLTFEIPPGFEGQVRPRSGLAFKHGITCLNSPGTIDADYRGEVKVLLINHGDEPFHVERGMRIAQMVIAPVYQAKIIERAKPTNSERGSGGFGSTGV
ncbi:MAG: dUTP diphosphatase [Pseudomonadota bacterium]